MNRVELLLKLALASKAAAELPGVPATPAPAPLGQPAVPGPVVPGNTPNTALDMAKGVQGANTPVELGNALNTPKAPAVEAPGVEAPPAGGFQTPEWLNQGLGWVKQHPGLSAAGLGTGALLAYMMSGHRRRKHAAAFTRLPVPRGHLAMPAKALRPDLAKSDPATVRAAIQSTAIRPKPSMDLTDTAVVPPKATPKPVGSDPHIENDPQTAPLYQSALQRGLPGTTANIIAPKPPISPMTGSEKVPTTGPHQASSGLIPNPRPSANLPTEKVTAPSKPVVPKAVTMGAAGTGLAAGGAAGGMAVQKHLDANAATAANPQGNAVPQTGTGNALGQTGDWLHKYLGGFAQSPTKWGGGQWAGAGAAGILAALLASRGNDDEE